MNTARMPKLRTSDHAANDRPSARPRRGTTAVAALLCLLALQVVTAGAASAETTVCTAGSCTTTFAETGGVQEWQVPTGVSSLTITAKGAGGGAASEESVKPVSGGSGGAATSTFTVLSGH